MMLMNEDGSSDTSETLNVDLLLIDKFNIFSLS